MIDDPFQPVDLFEENGFYLGWGRYYFPARGRNKGLRRQKKALRRCRKLAKRITGQIPGMLAAENPLLAGVESSDGHFAIVAVRLP